MAEKMSSSTEEPEEVAGELDDALNELGMLSSNVLPTNLVDKNCRLIKDKWSVAGRRGYPLRYPLRREKEREITWCSSSSGVSSSSSSSSSGSQSRRSSSTSSSSGSFCSSSSSCGRSYSRSSLISSYSIAETPTGNAPIGPFTTTTTTNPISSNSSLCCSIDLMDQQQSMANNSSCVKSVDNYPKVLRRFHQTSFKPYNLGIGRGVVTSMTSRRRFSLQLREEHPLGHSDNLNLRSGLCSDSEASSGSGTGTPPPPPHCGHVHCVHGQHNPISFQGLILDPIGTFNLGIRKSCSPIHFKEQQQLETKSNPGSPIQEQQQQPLCPLFHNRPNSINVSSTSTIRDTSNTFQRVPNVRCCGGSDMMIPCDLNTISSSGVALQSSTTNILTRSKSLDDLNYAQFLLSQQQSIDENLSDSCSSDAFGCQQQSINNPMATGYNVQQQQQQQRGHGFVNQQQLFHAQQQSENLIVGQSTVGGSSVGTTSIVNQSESHLAVISNSSTNPITSTSCDNLFDSVLQRIGRLEM